MRFQKSVGFPYMMWIPSRELTYPTWGKGKSSSKVPFLGDMLVPRRVILLAPTYAPKKMPQDSRITSWHVLACCVPPSPLQLAGGKPPSGVQYLPGMWPPYQDSIDHQQ